MLATGSGAKKKQRRRRIEPPIAIEKELQIMRIAAERVMRVAGGANQVFGQQCCRLPLDKIGILAQYLRPKRRHDGGIIKIADQRRELLSFIQRRSDTGKASCELRLDKLGCRSHSL